MSGMNAIFHFGSAAAAVLLTYLLLRARREAVFVKDLLLALRREGSRRVHVEAPAVFLERFAATFGIPCEIEGKAGAPARIASAPLTELLLRRELQLIRCREASVELHIGRGAGGPSAEALAAALGGNVDVKLIAR
jgi:hypothetical protein